MQVVPCCTKRSLNNAGIFRKIIKLRNLNAIETTVSYVWATMSESNVYILMFSRSNKVSLSNTSAHCQGQGTVPSVNIYWIGARYMIWPSLVKCQTIFIRSIEMWNANKLAASFIEPTKNDEAPFGGKWLLCYQVKPSKKGPFCTFQERNLFWVTSKLHVELATKGCIM